MTHVFGWEAAGYGGAAVAVLSVILASAALVKFDLYREALLSLISLVLCSFFVFGLVELFPGLARSLHLTNIHYYALHERYVTDDTLIFRVRPFYQLNRSRYAGYRGDLYKPIYGIDVPEIGYEGVFDKDGFRNVAERRNSAIVVLGDSFIEIGESEADLFTQKLERASGLSTTNLGSAWYGPFQYLQVLRRYGVERRPKYVVFSFFEGNDLNDIREYMHWLSGGDYYHFNLTSKGILGRYRLALRETIQHVKEITKLIDNPATVAVSRERTSPQPDIVDINLAGRQYKARFGYNIDMRDSSQVVQADEFKEFKRLLTEFRAMCSEHQIIPLLMFIPTKAHIYAEYTTELSDLNWMRIRSAQITAKDNVRNAIVGAANELNIRSVDLTPVFEKSAQEGNLLYYPFDTHWNPAARDLAADAVAKALASLRQDS